MGESNYCASCKKFMVFPDRHRCPPQWDVAHEDDGIENCEVVFSSDAEEAVKAFAEDSESDWDYPVANGGTVVILARLHGTEDAPKRFTVSGEPCIHYYASEE